jgi:hypothetical protein
MLLTLLGMGNFKYLRYTRHLLSAVRNFFDDRPLLSNLYAATTSTTPLAT